VQTLEINTTATSQQLNFSRGLINMDTGTRDLKNTVGCPIAVGILLIIVGILAMGTFLSLLGILAIASPIVAMRAVTVALSWALLIGGILRVIYAFETQGGRGFWLKLLLGILYIAISILLLREIIDSIFSLTLALGITIFIEGAIEVSLAFQLRPKSSWVWVLFSGITTIIAGIFLWSQPPFSDPGILALLPGISFLTTGIWTLTLSLTTRRPVSQA
jgi:uncharacterized membrane protein HdeD (DUF308 family)